MIALLPSASIAALYIDLVGRSDAPLYPAVAVAILVIASFCTPRPWIAACIGIVVTAVSIAATTQSTPLMRMCGAIVPGLYAFKLFVIARTQPALTVRGRVAFFFWPDMDGRAFLTPGHGRTDGPFLAAGAVGLIVGAAALVGAMWLHTRGLAPAAVYALALAGASAVLHFGILRIGAALLHAGGYRVKPLFTSPLGSRSLRAFWGGKWNAAFANLMRELFVRPLGPQRKTTAVAAAFVASAALHEMAITWPLDAGYGGPSLYFIIQAFAHGIESHLPAQRWGRVMTLFWVAAPVPLLFPFRFVSDIILIFPLSVSAMLVS